MIIYDQSGMPAIKRMIDGEVREVILDDTEIASLKEYAFNDLSAYLLETEIEENYREGVMEVFAANEDLAQEKVKALTEIILNFIEDNRSTLVSLALYARNSERREDPYEDEDYELY